MAQTQTLTLTEFLLARYDEEMPERAHDEGFDPSPYYESTYRHAGTCATVGSYDSPECDCGGAAWTIADLRAKQWIVGLHTPDHECTDGSDNYPGVMGAGMFEPYCPTIRALALPYVDHPDYREEWKP